MAGDKWRAILQEYIPLIIFDGFRGRHARFWEKSFRASETPFERGETGPHIDKMGWMRVLMKASNVTNCY